ncbi:MAG: DNA-directed RNA polymerase subunit omega [Elusimicrobia bacterium]|nr:DNA-directed RNA polymerase subunit omega [Elusimicrobiota bacterium]
MPESKKKSTQPQQEAKHSAKQSLPKAGARPLGLEAKHSRPLGQEKSLYQMILEQTHGKYDLVPLASQWARELKKQEETRNLSWHKVLEIAMKDAISGKITWKNIKQLAPNGEKDKDQKKQEEPGKKKAG